MGDPRSAYREAAVRGASPVQLVVLLYEQVLDDLHRALAALEQGKIEARTGAINHALMIIGHLQATLNLEHGGEIARNLDRFYAAVRKGLVEAQFAQSSNALQEQIRNLSLVHDAWKQVERENHAALLLSQSATAPSAPLPESSNSAGWSA